MIKSFITWILLFLLLASIGFSETWVEYNVVTNGIKSVRVGDGKKLGYCGNNNSNIIAGVLLEPDLSALTGVPRKYWKQSGGSVVEMNQGEKNGVDAALQAAEDASTAIRVDAGEITVLELLNALEVVVGTNKNSILTRVKEQLGVS